MKKYFKPSIFVLNVGSVAVYEYVYSPMSGSRQI